MYEIWLALNILWEISLGYMPLLIGTLVCWVALMGVALRSRRTRWIAGTLPAIISGAFFALIAFVAFPTLTAASLSAPAYWVDWAALSAIALAYGTMCFLITLPLWAMFKGGRARAEVPPFQR